MKVEVDMRQKGFATILVIALIVKGIQESETNHAREVLNFETEQALQSAAESGIVEAAEFVRNNPDYLPVSDSSDKSKIKIEIPNKTFDKTFYHGEQKIDIEVKVWGERGKIYFYDKDGANIPTFKYKDADGNIVMEKGKEIKLNYLYGVYLMSRATIEKGFFDEKIYRRAYAYILLKNQTKDEYKIYEKRAYRKYEKVFLEKFDALLNDENCEQKINFMELPQDLSPIIKSN